MSNYRKYNHILQCSLTVTFGFQIAGMCGQYLESQTQHSEAVEGVLEFIISHTLKVIHLFTIKVIHLLHQGNPSLTPLR